MANASGAGQHSIRWKQDLMKKASALYGHRFSSTTNLRKLIYSNTPLPTSLPEEAKEEEEEEESQEIGGLFQLTKKRAISIFHNEDTSLVVTPPQPPGTCQDWTAPSVVGVIKSLFVTGSWGAEGAQALLQEDDALYGDFEDLEASQEDGGEREGEEEGEGEDANKKRLEKKKRLKAEFDVGYDQKGEGQEGGASSYLDDLKREVSEQEQRNKAEFEGMDEQTRLQYEGVRPGYYVRLELKGEGRERERERERRGYKSSTLLPCLGVPCEFVEYFDPAYPVIVGGVLPEERQMGYMRVRLKKHRWHKRILKSFDPLVVSVGWQRYQTLPVYFIEDHNKRQRMIKYTPEHLHCNACFYGESDIRA